MVFVSFKSCWRCRALPIEDDEQEKSTFDEKLGNSTIEKSSRMQFSYFEALNLIQFSKELFSFET